MLFCTLLIFFVNVFIAAGIYAAGKLGPKNFFKPTEISWLVVFFSFVAAGEIVTVTILELLVEKFTLIRFSLSDARTAVFVFALLCSAGLGVYRFYSGRNTGLRAFAKKCAIYAAVALAAESLIFNAVCYKTTTFATNIPLQSFTVSGAEWIGEKLSLSETAKLELENCSGNAGAIRLNFSGGNNSLVVTLLIKDDNSTMQNVVVARSKADCEGDACVLSFNPQGDLRSLILNFDSVTMGEKTSALVSVDILSSKPYSFSQLRYAILLAVLCFFAAVRKLDIFKYRYSSKNPFQLAVIAVLMLVFVSKSGVFFKEEKNNPYKYPFAANVSYPELYSATFDALKNGHTYLDIPVSDELLALENPYDHSVREGTGVPYVYDCAFYEGKYYNYFGVAPVIAFWFPYEAMTGTVPTLNIVHTFICKLLIVALFGAILALVRRFCRDVSFVSLLLVLCSSVICTGILAPAFYSDIYFIPVAFAILFLLICLWAGLSAADSNNNILRVILLFVSGLSFIFAVGSRPTTSVFALILIPVFVSLLRSDKFTIKTKLVCAASFAAPIIVGGALLMAYNNARFDSPFDFGMAYQLTVCDVRQKQINPQLLPSSMWYYFLQLPCVTTDFPFLLTQPTIFANTGQYAYIEGGIGLLTIPAVAAATLLLPKLLKSRAIDAQKRAVYILVPLVCLGLAFFEFCLAGYNLRYAFDLLPIVYIFSMLVLLEAQTRARRYSSLKFGFEVVSSGAVMLSVFYALIISAGCNLSSFFVLHPEYYYELKKLIVFWR